MDNIPEKFKSPDGTLNAEALMKSYSELEKKMGTMVAIPTADSDTHVREKFNRAIGVPQNASEYPTNDVFDDDSLREKFLEIGLTKHQVEKIYSIANDFLLPLVGDLISMRDDENAYGQLKNFFGSDEKMRDALNAINDFGQRFLPRDAFDELCATSQGIQGIYRMMQSVEPHVQTDKNTPENFSDDDLRRMMRNPKYWRDNDPEYVRKIENGFKKLYS